MRKFFHFQVAQRQVGHCVRYKVHFLFTNCLVIKTCCNTSGVLFDWSCLDQSADFLYLDVLPENCQFPLRPSVFKLSEYLYLSKTSFPGCHSGATEHVKIPYHRHWSVTSCYCLTSFLNRFQAAQFHNLGYSLNKSRFTDKF